MKAVETATDEAGHFRREVMGITELLVLGRLSPAYASEGSGLVTLYQAPNIMLRHAQTARDGASEWREIRPPSGSQRQRAMIAMGQCLHDRQTKPTLPV
jgi:hypothetical protein